MMDKRHSLFSTRHRPNCEPGTLTSTDADTTTAQHRAKCARL